MIRRTTVLAYGALTLTTGACRDPSGPSLGASLELRATAGTYHRAAGATPTFVLAHSGGRTVALTGCPEPPAATLERRTALGWEEAGSQGMICLGIHSPKTVTLQAGGQLRFSLTPVQPGRYRARVHVGPDYGAPEATITSDEFEVIQ